MNWAAQHTSTVAHGRAVRNDMQISSSSRGDALTVRWEGHGPSVAGAAGGHESPVLEGPLQNCISLVWTVNRKPEVGWALVGKVTTPEAEPRITSKGAATRRRIVEAAADLMYEHGVAGTSVEDVQRAAEVSASQVYYHFANKQCLVRAVIAYQSEAVLSLHLPMLSRLDSIDALEAWRDFVVSRARWRRNQRGCPIGSLSSELASKDPEARVELLAGFSRWEHAIRGGLTAMRDRGDLRPETDPARLALAMLAVVQGGLLLTAARRDTHALEAGLDAIIDGIRAGQPRPTKPRPKGKAAGRRS